MYPSGIKASELIKILQKNIEKYGDLECYSGGTDYPEGVSGVGRETTGNGYIPKNTFVIG